MPRSMTLGEELVPLLVVLGITMLWARTLAHSAYTAAHIRVVLVFALFQLIALLQLSVL
jgi:hypothetical protein